MEYLIIYEATPRVSMATKPAKCITNGKKRRTKFRTK